MDLFKQLIIGPASLRDLPDLRALEKVCFPIDRWPLLDLIGVLSVPGVIRMKALVNGEFAGFVGADIRKREATGWIVTIAVSPKYRNMGIGSKLLLSCENETDMPIIKVIGKKK